MSAPRLQAGDVIDALPLFPLPQVVLFPGAHLPLHVFEPRYRAMTRDALAGDRLMAAVQIVGERRDANGHPPIASCTGVGRIVQHHELPDGRFNILLLGVGRAELQELEFVAPYRRARATVLATRPTPTPAAEITGLLSAAARFAALIDQHRGGEEPLGLPRSDQRPGEVVDLVAHQLIVEGGERQALLEELDDRARVQRATELLAMQCLMLDHARAPD